MCARRGRGKCEQCALAGGCPSAPWAIRLQMFERPDAVRCDDGAKLPANVKYWWNAATMEGVIGFFFPEDVATRRPGVSGRFTLVKTV